MRQRRESCRRQRVSYNCFGHAGSHVENGENLFHSACDLLNIISVVGTNGKTSTTYLLDAILKETGEKTAVIGSNGVWIGERRIKSALTTPDPIDLHELFYKIHLNKIRYVIMEVSAHAIALKKWKA